MSDQDASSSSTQPADPQPGGGQPVPRPADFSISTLPPAPALAPGSLGEPVALPAALAKPLAARERLLARHLAEGLSWQQACDKARVPPRARIRSYKPTRKILEAAEYLTIETAYQCGVSRRWVLSNCVALYRRACSAEKVLDKSGKPTGEWRYDGATAARMLQLLGEDIGMFGKGKQPGIGVDQVAALLEAVASRGRRQLEPERGRLVGAGSIVTRGAAAPQQSEKAITDQQPIPADSSVISQELQGSPK